MTATLTEKEFSQHLNTTFHVMFSDGQVDLELDEVKGYLSKAVEQEGMERFSAFFQGPSQPQLRQMLYAFQHAEMGEFEMFLVPIAKNEKGFRYESVFNYFKKSE